MTRKIATLLLLAVLSLSGCDKIKTKVASLRKKPKILATPPPLVAASPASATPAPALAKAPDPAAPDINPHAAVMVLCYHRFEDRPKDSLAINPAEFARQMQAVKDAGFSVIPMGDFLAWRRGEKAIPDKSCVVSIDDGYRSGYDVAWPILKKHNYPFTMFIYTNYVKGQPNAGGQSMSWEELAEMRDAGVDIESHTISHTNLREKTGKWQRLQPNYEAWLKHEMADSKKMLEQNLGISVKVLAYPYGNHNEEIRRIAMESGYEAAFTVYGQRISHTSAPDQLGRYAIDSTKPKVFEEALKMIGGGAASTGPYTSSMPANTLLVQPADGETTGNAMPTVKANLATLGDVDPQSVVMRISGLGVVPAKFDPSSKIVEYQITQKLREPSYTVILGAKIRGKAQPVEHRWTFKFDPTAAPGDAGDDAPLPPRTSTPLLPPPATTPAPPATPAKKKK
jgi:peptidoglycan/xylan/chitin deacetylase (PgdA/CDA1 family)